MRNSREPFPMPAVPRSFKKYILFQIVGISLIIYIWYIINGGFIPKFLVPRLPFLDVGPDVGCLVFFNKDGDASKVRWAREVNSREAVKAAMKDDKVDMIAADVILRGHGTTSQTLVPVMARPPKTNSDITLSDWLQEIKFGSKGIKLHFHSIESVEISLQILKDFNELNPMKYPVWIHADVLQGPHGGPTVIDLQRFVKTQKRLFPRCTLSLGWTTATQTDMRQSAYTWEMVWDMLDMVQEWDFENQLLVFQARLSLTHNSVPQLKWLADNTGASLMVWNADGDAVINEDIMHLAYRFSLEKIYFDLGHPELQLHLDRHRYYSRTKLDHFALKRDEVMFKHDMWLKMGFHRQKNSILASTEAIILASPLVYIITKSKYLPTSEIYIQGRIRFFNRNNREAEDYRTGLDIYLRATKYDSFEEIVGIRCFIGVGGEVEVTGSNLPEKIEKFRNTARVTPTSSNCYRFKIVDEKYRVTIAVQPLHDCTTLESVEEEVEMVPLVKVEIPSRLTSNEQRPFILKMDDVKRQGLIDEISVKHKL
ncbi:uncharacterized protein LOC101863315 [Aplysia californica]|uniref:Uncharacterized protein LOC101863315 n=1 Tax=Aplysia californica TaxID=6500 RepID=A0ABM0JBV2_APLCA|nr:uncharacterized protein LOC101863315 [Aplysia californica]